MVPTLCKNGCSFCFVFCVFLFCQKSSKFRVVWTIRYCSNFTSMCYKHSLRKVWRDLRLLMSALMTVAGKSFNGKFTPKFDFPIGHFMLSLLILTLKVLSLSIHYLISIWTTCWWNWNKIVWSELYRILIFLTKKMVNHFWQNVDAILEDVSVNETIIWCQTINQETIIFQCSKNYGSPTRVTRLKVEPNMADSISLNEKRP